MNSYTPIFDETTIFDEVNRTFVGDTFVPKGRDNNTRGFAKKRAKAKRAKQTRKMNRGR